MLVRANFDKGLRIYPEYTPLQNPCDASSGPAPQYLYRILSYRNTGDGIFVNTHGTRENLSARELNDAFF